MGKFFFTLFLHSLEKISLEVRRLFCLVNLLLFTHLHFNPVILLHSDEDGTYISNSTKYEPNRSSLR